MCSVQKVLLILMALVVAIGCSKPNPPQYVGYQNFRLAKASFSENILATDIKLYNPNKYALKLKSASLDVYLNNKFFGHTSLDSTISLAAQDTTLIPLRITASAKDILKNTALLLLNPDIKLRLEGSVKAGRGGFFINVPINYEAVQRIDLTELLKSNN